MKITPLIASRFLVDGGAMYSLVPKPIWNRLTPADEKNRIPQNLNAWLLELDDGRLGIVDPGCGDPESYPAKDRRINGLADEWLGTELDRVGVDRAKISFVILTHLHWDHSGGVGSDTESGETRLTFPNAEYYVHQFEWDDATGDNPYLFKAYPPTTITPLLHVDKSMLHLVDGEDTEILPGVRFILAGGHTRGSCTVFIDGQPELVHPSAEDCPITSGILFASDVCPTQHHLRMVFSTSFDTYPIDTRRWKRKWLTRVAEEQIVLWFDHDHEVFAARLAADPRAEFIMTHELPAKT
tara:strand:- start:902 stop:1792 length:891 start_codon:yes stop_codon:yes gene_type:complete